MIQLTRKPWKQPIILLMERRPLPAVRDLTCDGRWSTYDVSELKKGEDAHRQDTL